MNCFLKITIAALGLLSFLASADSGTAQEFRLKLHHFNSPQSLAHQQFLVPWAKKIEQASAGRIKVDVYPAMQLGGKPGDLYAQVRDGVVDLAWTLQGYSAGQFPLTSVMELPFLSPSTEVSSTVLMGLYEGELRKEYDSVKVIALHTTDPNALHTKVPVRTLTDMKAMKVRVASRWIGQTIEALGGTPISVPLPDIAQAVSRGQIDGFVIGWSVTRPFKLYELVKGHTEVSFGTSPAMLVMNQKTYDALPTDLKKVIDDNSGIKLASRLGRIWDEDVKKSREAARKAGNTIVDLPTAELGKWRQAGQGVVNEWISANSKAGDSRGIYQEVLQRIEKQNK